MRLLFPFLFLFIVSCSQNNKYEYILKEDNFKYNFELNKDQSFVDLEEGFTFYNATNQNSQKTPVVLIHGFSIDDFTKPSNILRLGSRHPISIVKNKIIDIFLKIGFDISEGPEIEDDWHNFTALNLPEYHPARDMQDTFYLSKDPDWLLRTHTSSVQIRHMENNKPPIRTISPGRVYKKTLIKNSISRSLYIN